MEASPRVAGDALTVADDIERAKKAILRAPVLDLGGGVSVRDMRGLGLYKVVHMFKQSVASSYYAIGSYDEGMLDLDSDKSCTVVYRLVSASVPELQEAAALLGVGYVAGRGKKYTCSGSSAQVQAWVDWARSNGLTGIYGGPDCGFAGGYLTE